MNIFEITIQRQWQANSWPVVVKRTSSGNLLPKHTTGTLHLCKDDFLKLTQLRHQPRKYGTLLGKALFQEDIRDAFIEAISSRTDNSQVRVLLCVEADDLKFLYWHWLCVPSKWDFLALNQRVPLSLYIPSHADRRFPPIGRRNLRALIFVANPEDLSSYKLHPFDATETVETIQTALGDIPSDVLAMTTGAVGKPTLKELCGQLTQQSYTLLHIVCHGQYRDGKTWLYVSGEENQVEPVVDTVLIERLDRLGEQRGLPHFVFLSACESAVPEAEQTEAALGGLGQRLVRELGIPAVIAMTQNITIKTAGLLSAEFYQRLYEHGEVDLSLVEATATLAERYDILFPALFNRLGGQPLFSETLDRDPTNAEIEQGLSSLEVILPKQAPILQDQFNQFQNLLKKTLKTNPEALSNEAQKDRQNALQDLNSLCTEVVEISFNALALGELPPEYDSRCPFRGLYPFRTEDREFFFGRDELIQQLKTKLEKHNFLAVLGRSGSGKSSVVLAGLIPALGLDSKTQVAYLTPSNNPVEQLDVSLSKTPEQQLVIVDQFEELFTLCHDENSRIEFIDRLIKLIKTQKLVITMRADFWGECAPYVQLKELMEAQQLLIAPMNSQELKQAMEQQAERVGLRFADGLSDSILDDVQAEPGAMPLLQHALQELWKRRHGRWLLWEEYRAIGGVKKAIARTADAVYHNLEPDEQDLVRNIFIRLTRLQENAVQGYERRDTRQRVKMEELVPTDSRLDQIKKLVNRLADARLVVINQQKVEVAHEALIQFWPTLRTWLEEDWQNLRLRQLIGQSASEWQEYERDESYLILRGRRLEEARELLNSQSQVLLNDLECNYIRACFAAREQERMNAAEQRLKDLSEMGWGVIFAHNEDPEVIEALQVLLEHRRKQATRQSPNYYHEFIGVKAYRPGETKQGFLNRNGVGSSGRANPDKIPYYLLIVGDPNVIPFEFQYQLDIQYAVGRIHFDTPEEYAQYARSVVEAETHKISLPRCLSIFAPQNPDDKATQLSCDSLVEPLVQQLSEEQPDWEIKPVIREKATKSRLSQLLGGSETSALLFTASHGIGFPNDNPQQLPHQGALICQDWPGSSVREPIPQDHYFSADDVSYDAHLHGLITFFSSGFSSGVPELDNYGHIALRAGIFTNAEMRHL